MTRNSPSNSSQQAKPSSSSRNGMTPEQLEAKRATNRLSARRCRLRQKNLIKQLQNKNTLLSSENRSLKLKLELALAENKRMELIHNQEMKRANERSRALSCIVKENQAQKQAATPRNSVTTASALLQLAAGDSPSPTPELELVPPSPPSRSEQHQQIFRSRELGGSRVPRFPTLMSPPRLALRSNGLSPFAPQENGGVDVGATQLQIQRLREELQGLRDYLARHSI